MKVRKKQEGQEVESCLGNALHLDCIQSHRALAETGEPEICLRHDATLQRKISSVTKRVCEACVGADFSDGGDQSLDKSVFGRHTTNDENQNRRIQNKRDNTKNGVLLFVFGREVGA